MCNMQAISILTKDQILLQTDNLKGESSSTVPEKDFELSE